MKKQDRISRVPGSEKIGEALAHSLHEVPAGECLSLEEIAALVDGKIKAGERDRILGHLSSCDRCYEVFLLASELKERRFQRFAGKSFMSHPLRLAASIIVAAFSIFLFYKIVFIPRAAEEPQPARTVLKDEISVHERRDEAPKEEKIGGVKAPESGKARLTTGRREEAFSVDRKEPAPGKEKAAEAATRTLPEGKPVEESQQQVGGVASLGQDAGQQTVRQKKSLAAAQRDLVRDSQQQQYLQKKHDYRQREQEPAAPQKGVTAAKRGAEAKFQEALLEGGKGAQRADIPAAELESLFREAVTQAGILQRRLDAKSSEGFGADEDRKAADDVARLKPALDALVIGDSHFVRPNLDYFLQRSKPGSPQFRFFTLARSGWCDPQGLCRGEHGYPAWLEPADAVSDKEKRETRDKLLAEWLALRPQLSGIYKEIADLTIAHLQKTPLP